MGRKDLIANTCLKKTTLITGANGFIGSLLQKDYYPVHEVVSKLPLHSRIWMFFMLKFLLSLVANLRGHHATIARLYNSLQIDIIKAQKILNWSPVISLDETLTDALSMKGR